MPPRPEPRPAVERGVAVPARRFGFAWLALCGVLALHVTDEALTDFLSVYNPAVRALRAHAPFLPLPTFTFGVWLAGLVAGIALLFALAPLAFRGRRLAVWLAHLYALIMFANGLGHIGGSFYLGRWAPGMTTAPLLLVASAWLFRTARQVPRAEP